MAIVSGENMKYSYQALLRGSAVTWVVSWVAVPCLLFAIVTAARAPERPQVSNNNRTNYTSSWAEGSDSGVETLQQVSAQSTANGSAAVVEVSQQTRQSVISQRGYNTNRPVTPPSLSVQHSNALLQYFQAHPDGQSYASQIPAVLNAFKGFEDGLLRLEDHMSRAQAASAIARTFNLQRTDRTHSLVPVFADVNPRDVHAYNIAALYEQGVTNGCAVNPLRFCPAAAINRRQFAVLLANAVKTTAGIQLPTGRNQHNYHDVTSGTQGSQEIQTLQRAGLLNACGWTQGEGYYFCPDSALTRGEAARILARLFALID